MTDKHISKPLELNFSTLLGFDQLPKLGNSRDETEQMKHLAINSKVGGKLAPLLGSQLGSKAGLKPIKGSKFGM